MHSLSFNITARDPNSNARTAIIKTPHGIIKTPDFIPVATQATVKALTKQHLSDLNTQILMINTYHLYLRPGADLIAKFGGLHNFMSWQKPIMTDSGGFQIFSLGKTKEGKSLVKVTDKNITFRSHIDYSPHNFTPEKSIEIQEKLGADIIFAFDECIQFNADKQTVTHSTARTNRWAERCLAAKKRKDQALFGIVQGGKYKDLRQESARFISSLPVAGYGIGSIFGEPKKETVNVLKWAMGELPGNKPVHLLGIGAVDDIFMGVENGIDTFDCVLPTRLARVGYIFSSECNKKTKWRYRITNSRFRTDTEPLDKNCSCYVCKNFSRAYIHHLFKANELLSYTLATYHNLAFFSNLMKSIRDSIENDSFKKLKKKWLK